MSVTIAVVVVGAILMWAFDRDKQYASYGEALWFTLQTVTTVGYGDTTPTSAIGRVVAAVVMLTGIEADHRGDRQQSPRCSSRPHESGWRSPEAGQAAAREPSPFARMEESLAEIAERLERLEDRRHENRRMAVPAGRDRFRK